MSEEVERLRAKKKKIYEELMKRIKYTIESSIDDEKWTLYSHVDTNYNGIAKNFICEGTLEECESRMKQMKALDGLVKQTQELELDETKDTKDT